MSGPTPPNPHRIDWLDACVVVLAGLVLLFALGSAGLWSPWETNPAALGRHLADEGGWGAFSHQGRPLSRPPLVPWLTGASFSLLGVSEWSARLPMALAGLLCVWLLFRGASRLFSPRAGVAAAVVLVGSPLFLLQARHLLGNAPLMLGETMCVLALPALAASRDPRAAILLVAGASIALLSAGAHGLVVPGLTALVFLLVAPRARWRLAPWVAVLAAACLGFAWLATGAAEGSALAGLGHRLHPFFSARAPKVPETFDHVVRQIGIGTLPWAALLPVAFARLAFLRPTCSEQESEAAAPGADLALAWLAAGVVGAYLGLVFGRHPLFSSLPAVALGVGALAALPRPGGRAAVLSAVAVAAMLWMLMRDVVSDPSRLLFGLTADGKLDYPGAVRFSRFVQALVVVWGGGAVGYLLAPALGAGRLLRPLRAALEPPGRAALAVLVTGLAVAASLSQGYARDLSAHLSEKGVIDAWRRLAREGEPLYRHLIPKAEASFYAGGHAELATSSDLSRAVQSDGRVFVLVPASRLPNVNKSLRGVLGHHVPVVDDSSSKLLLLSNRVGEGEEDRNPLLHSVRNTAPEKMDLRLGVDLDGKVELAGADLSDKEVRLGNAFDLTLHFRVKKPITRTYKVFVHVDTSGHRIDTSTTDHEPVAGLYKTTDWQPGDWIADTHRIKLPLIGTPTGRYTIWAGLFVGDTRMKASPRPKHDGDNRVRIGHIQVKAL